MSIEERLDELRDMILVLVKGQQVREYYSTDEFAKLVGKAEFTVREWCRLHRIHASKRRSGRGAHPAWVIAHEELLRFQKEGLLPVPDLYRQGYRP
jgi:hypothetical protein